MAKAKVRFKVRGSIFDKLTDILLLRFGKSARQNFGDFRPFIEDAIDEGVINSRSEFIPDSDEAAELGIGRGGTFDRERTHGAWRQLLSNSNEKIITFSIRKDTRRKRIGDISINIDEGALLRAPLSNVDTESDDLPSIPWLEWLINGAPAGAIQPNFEFSTRVPPTSESRTGAGRMVHVRGGVWEFSPKRLGAFKLLTSEIERQVIIAVKKDIGKVI